MVEAIDGADRHFVCTEIRRCGPTGVDAKNDTRPCGIARSMWRAESAWRKEIAATRLADIQQLGLVETPPEQTAKAIA